MEYVIVAKVAKVTILTALAETTLNHKSGNKKQIIMFTFSKVPLDALLVP